MQFYSVKIYCNCVMIFFTNANNFLQRKSDGEHESSRRLKTQFLIEMEGFDSGSEQILLIGYYRLTGFKFLFYLAQQYTQILAHCLFLSW